MRYHLQALQISHIFIYIKLITYKDHKIEILLTVRSMVLANRRPRRFPGVNSLVFSFTNGLNTWDTALLILRGVLLKENARLTRLLNLQLKRILNTNL